MTKYYTAFLIIIFAGISGYFIFHFGLYPIAFVNGQTIFAKSFNEIYASAFNYYAKIAAISQNAGLDFNSPDFKEELNREITNQLIERVLVYSGLKNMVGEELETLVARKLDIPNLTNKEFGDSIQELYKLTVAEFRALVLVPQAQREVFADRLNSEEKSFRSWLTEAKKTAKVTLLVTGLTWSDGELLRD